MPLLSAHRTRLAAAAVTLLSVLPGAAASPPAAAKTATVKVAVSTTPAGTSSLALGVTHTQYSLDAWGDPAAVSAGRSLLAAAPLQQNQHIMGWGALNPEPSPGVYDWKTLDARVGLMVATTATPTITFAGAPDWMKGGTAGATDWSKLEVAPLPEFYDDFAHLAATVAQRYPQVRRFQVWNELKGFHDPTTNRWDAAAYTDMYNQVHDAVTSVRPDAVIGGPYVVIDSWGTASAGGFPSSLYGPWGIIDQRSLDVVTYWLANSRGGDFLSVDAKSSTRDKGLLGSPFEAIQKFVTATDWLRARTGLPIVWSEWYPIATSSDVAEQSAVLAEGLAAVATAGASGVLLWGPQCVAPATSGCLFTDTRVAGGGVKTRLYDVTVAFARSFGPGAAFRSTSVSSPSVRVLATPATLLLVNKTAAKVAISGVKGVTALAPYEVRFVAR
ncbi:MAG TPA: hypothetical protein VFV35_01445 [Acidimicrobiales bacterium]|nr:hypothetical protein [Acidimicrobiales bacterium]